MAEKTIQAITPEPEKPEVQAGRDVINKVRSRRPDSSDEQVRTQILKWKSNLQAQLDEVAEMLEKQNALMEAKMKSVPETASAQTEYQPTVVSSTDGAKVLNNLDNLQKEYQEKTNLIDRRDEISSSFTTNEDANFDYKDKRLISILQTDASKVVDANGEPMVVYHGSYCCDLLLNLYL